MGSIGVSSKLGGTGSRIDKFELSRLLAGFKKGAPPVPVVGLDAPHPEKWITKEEYDKLGKLERECIQFYKGAYEYLTGTNRDDKALDPDTRDASGQELQIAMQNLRRSCKITEAPHINADGQILVEPKYLWMLGLSQFLVGTAFSQEGRDPSYIRRMRTILSHLNTAFAGVPTNERLPLTEHVSIPITSFREQFWLPDPSRPGDRLGWLSDDILYAVMRAYASSQAHVQIVDPIVFHSWARRLKQGNDNGEVNVAPPIPPNTEVVLVPINVAGNHWTLGVVNLIRNDIYELDSLGGAVAQSHVPLRHLLEANGIDLDRFHTPTRGEVESQPLQNNTYDCGVWLIANARAIIDRDRPAAQRPAEEVRFEILNNTYRFSQEWRASDTQRNMQNNRSDHVIWQRNE